MGRIVLAAIAGGLIVFLWSFIHHEVLGWGETDFHGVRDEAALMAALQEQLPASGYYAVPGFEPATATPEIKKAAMERMKSGPNALIVWNTTGADMMDLMRFVGSWAANVVSALLAAIVAAWGGSGFFSRSLLVTLMGVFSWVTVEVPRTLWFRIPTDATMYEGAKHLISWLLAGLVIALILREPRGAD